MDTFKISGFIDHNSVQTIKNNSYWINPMSPLIMINSGGGDINAGFNLASFLHNFTSVDTLNENDTSSIAIVPFTSVPLLSRHCYVNSTFTFHRAEITKAAGQTTSDFEDQRNSLNSRLRHWYQKTTKLTDSQITDFQKSKYGITYSAIEACEYGIVGSIWDPLRVKCNVVSNNFSKVP